MGGVDLHGMLVSLYRINIRVRRYYLRVVFHLLDMCAVNAWLLYRKQCKRNSINHKPFVSFKLEIANALLTAGKINERKKGRPTLEAIENQIPVRNTKSKAPMPVADARYDALDHWPEHKEQKSRCKLCIKSYSRLNVQNATSHYVYQIRKTVLKRFT